MAPEVKPAKNSKLPKLPENYFEPVGKGGWPPISTWIRRDAFKSIKDAIGKSLVLISPNYSKYFQIFSFASKDTIAGALL
jgi:hypothetical protein